MERSYIAKNKYSSSGEVFLELQSLLPWLLAAPLEAAFLDGGALFKLLYKAYFLTNCNQIKLDMFKKWPFNCVKQTLICMHLIKCI